MRFFSYGACSVILFCDNKEIECLYKSIISEIPNTEETWTIENGLVDLNRFEHKDNRTPYIGELPKINNYSKLPLTIRSVLDETIVAIQMLKDKAQGHDSLQLIEQLVKIVNISIEELLFLSSIQNSTNIETIPTPPKTMYLKSKKKLADPLERQTQQQQIIDRLIQVNACLSYVSTQANSGSTPILERRSLIRRSSLLGVGTAIRALNTIIRYIENAFSAISFLKIVTKGMVEIEALSAFEKAYKKLNWKRGEVDKIWEQLQNRVEEDEEDYSEIKKINYFSSRYAFRETEFCITASVNSISSGFSLEWSLLTLSHEMLHSHVRLIIDSIFYEEDEGNEDYEEYRSFYDKFYKRIDHIKNKQDGNSFNYTFLDSVREAIFSYILGTLSYGSISELRKIGSNDNEGKYGSRFVIPAYSVPYQVFHKTLSSEYKNINEIFVHVLDLHYFYSGNLSKYIPMIWCSWAAVPHVNADIRQYILRTLLIIASKINRTYDERWSSSIDELKGIISKNEKLLVDYPIFETILKELNDEEKLEDFYIGVFKNSLILVDLATSVFFSSKVKAALWNDDNVIFSNPEEEIEANYSYDVTLNFMDVKIKCPIPYIYDRLSRVLNEEVSGDEIERYTAIGFLAINSNK